MVVLSDNVFLLCRAVLIENILKYNPAGLSGAEEDKIILKKEY